MTPSPSQARQREVRAHWLGTLLKYRHDFGAPAHTRYWSPALDTCSRDELRAILAKTEFKAKRVRDERKT